MVSDPEITERRSRPPVAALVLVARLVAHVQVAEDPTPTTVLHLQVTVPKTFLVCVFKKVESQCFSTFLLFSLPSARFPISFAYAERSKTKTKKKRTFPSHPDFSYLDWVCGIFSLTVLERINCSEGSRR